MLPKHARYRTAPHPVVRTYILYQILPFLSSPRLKKFHPRALFPRVIVVIREIAKLAYSPFSSMA